MTVTRLGLQTFRRDGQPRLAVRVTLLEVRRTYNWGVGDYSVRIAPDGSDSHGEWFGLWITDKATDITTWIGSLKFPYLDDTAAFRYSSYTVMEIYGWGGIRPIDIPEWYASIGLPTADGVRATSGYTYYSTFTGKIMNSNVRYDPINEVFHIQAGGTTERTYPESEIRFE